MRRGGSADINDIDLLKQIGERPAAADSMERSQLIALRLLRR
jgi:hypothetical protein